MKPVCVAALLSALLLAGCDKFPQNEYPSRSTGVGAMGIYNPDAARRDPGAATRERETSVGEYSRRPKGEQF